MEEKYILVRWAKSQILMEQVWFDECILMNDDNHLQEIGSAAYFVPENRYNELHYSDDFSIEKQDEEFEEEF